MVPMISASQRIPVKTYLIDLVLSFDKSPLIRHGVLALEFAREQTAPYQVLLGRDILCGGHLTLSFDGHLVFSL